MTTSKFLFETKDLARKLVKLQTKGFVKVHEDTIGGSKREFYVRNRQQTSYGAAIVCDNGQLVSLRYNFCEPIGTFFLKAFERATRK
jgi:hypothetical protein